MYLALSLSRSLALSLSRARALSLSLPLPLSLSLCERACVREYTVSVNSINTGPSLNKHAHFV